jgi:hypothetical protein
MFRNIPFNDGPNNLITFMTKQEIKNRFSADNPVADLWKAAKSSSTENRYEL